MKGKSDNGITSKSSKEYLKSLKLEYETKKEEIRIQLANPTISESEKENLRKEQQKLETEYKSKIKNSPFSLF